MISRVIHRGRNLISYALKSSRFLSSVNLSSLKDHVILDEGLPDCNVKDLNAEEFRSLHQIRLKGADNDSFNPFFKFDDSPFNDPVKRVLKAEGYTAPTPIQAQSWPIALAGRDMISVARTGSGKTCGFLLPAFHKLLTPESVDPALTTNIRRRVKRNIPRVLVIAPTRELAVQIGEQF